MTRAQDLSTQIRGLLDELDLELAGGQADTPNVTTVEELLAACELGGDYHVAAGRYVGNFICRVPLKLYSDGAILEPADPFEPVLWILSSDVTIKGFTIKLGRPDREAVVVGDFYATAAPAQPQNVTIDGCAVEATPTGGKRGIALHGSNLTVRDSRVTGFWYGADSQAIWIHNGPGPYLIENNYLEASGENLMSGGEAIHIKDCIPSDITIRGNTFFKPDAWRTNGAKVKNLLEIKNGQRVLIEGNVLDGCWRSGQNGNALVLTVRNQHGDSPWVIVDDVVVRGNIIKRCEGPAVSILGWDNNPGGSQQSQRMLFEHNLFADAPIGFSIQNGVAKALGIQNNTMPLVKSSFLILSDTRADKTSPNPNWDLAVKSPLMFTKNVVASGAYGISGTDSGVGVPALSHYTEVMSFVENVIEKSAQRGIPYPTGNRLVEPGQLMPLLDPDTLKMLDGSAGY